MLDLFNLKACTAIIPLPNDILDLSILKAFSEDKIKSDLALSQSTNFRLFQTERACRQQFHI